MNSQARTLIIVNPASARALQAWPHIKDALGQARLSFEMHETAYAGEATERTRRALRDGYNLIAVVGGDGTLSETASGFFEFGEDENQSITHPPTPVNADAALAILPAGTGDDFARGLAGGRESLDKWLAHFIAYCHHQDSPATRVVDVIQGLVQQGERNFIYLNVATIGLGAEVASRVAAQGGLLKRLPGEARFVAAACGALAAWREKRVRVTVDESEVIESRTNLLAVANGIYAGGGMMFAPHAESDDGLIDLVLTRDLSRRTIMRELPRIRRGAHLANERVRIIKARHVRVETEGPEDALLVEADGNVRGHTPAEFRIMPGALRIVQNAK